MGAVAREGGAHARGYCWNREADSTDGDVMCAIQSIRRSIKGEKAPDFSSSYGTGNPTQRHTHMSITPKSALTITPPKKVSRWEVGIELDGWLG